jgi:thioredoxin reductase (NADPH)
VLGRGQFTGDVAHLSGGPSLVSAVARVDCDVYEVAAEGVREIINRFPDLGDVILQAFIARRQLLRQSAAFRACASSGRAFRGTPGASATS